MATPSPVNPPTEFTDPLELFRAAARLANLDLPLETTLQGLAAAAASATGAVAGWISLIAPGGAEIEAHYFAGLPDTAARSYLLEGSPDAALLAADTPLVLDLGAYAKHASVNHLDLPTLAGMALRSAGQVYGTLKTLFAPDMLPTPEGLNALESLGYLAAARLRSHCLDVEVHQLNITDPLTGLYNQRHFLEIAGLEVGRAQRYARPFSLVMMDIDLFRAINDEHGHSVGDQVLQSVSQTLQANLRAVDILARYGGEEFVLVLPETGLTEALGVAGRLLYTLRAAPAQTSAGEIGVTMSIGVAGEPGGGQFTLDKLLDRADKALYQSKKNGRNRVTVWLED